MTAPNGRWTGAQRASSTSTSQVRAGPPEGNHWVEVELEERARVGLDQWREVESGVAVENWLKDWSSGEGPESEGRKAA